MKRLAPIACLALLLAGTGCHLFSKKEPATPKEKPDIASQVEADFMQRWIDKRTGELVASGSTPAAAHDRAVAEFRTQYSYTEAAQKLAPTGR
jgi:hypothetical protein